MTQCPAQSKANVSMACHCVALGSFRSSDGCVARVQLAPAYLTHLASLSAVRALIPPWPPQERICPGQLLFAEPAATSCDCGFAPSHSHWQFLQGIETCCEPGLNLTWPLRAQLGLWLRLSLTMDDKIQWPCVSGPGYPHSQLLASLPAALALQVASSSSVHPGADPGSCQ